MKQRHLWLSIIACISITLACGESDKEAKQYLLNIRSLYEAGEYDAAKAKIDSIQILYPKAFTQIKEGLALLQDVRRAQDTKQIAYCDSLINVLEQKIDSVKQRFTLDKNKDYEEVGRYIPKILPSNSLTYNHLRSGVTEEGQLYIESVYIGGQYHNKARIQAKDGTFVETLPVNGDGVNFRFSDLGKQYEIIKFSGTDENGIAKFIYTNADKPLTVILQGKNTLSYPLSANSKRSVSESFQLSMLMQESDSLKDVKNISLARIESLNRKARQAEEQTTEE